jgi:hypothetical protein
VIAADFSHRAFRVAVNGQFSVSDDTKLVLSTALSTSKVGVRVPDTKPKEVDFVYLRKDAKRGSFSYFFSYPLSAFARQRNTQMSEGGTASEQTSGSSPGTFRLRIPNTVHQAVGSRQLLPEETYKVRVDNPSTSNKTYATIQVNATDAAANAVTERINRAYVVPARLSRPSARPALDRSGRHDSTPSCAKRAPRHVRCFMLVGSGVQHLSFSADPKGYGPLDLRDAYNLPRGTGAGQQLAVVFAYDAPSAEGDLAHYRKQGRPTSREMSQRWSVLVVRRCITRRTCGVGGRMPGPAPAAVALHTSPSPPTRAIRPVTCARLQTYRRWLLRRRVSRFTTRSGSAYFMVGSWPAARVCRHR